MEDSGAGELLVTSMDKDGTQLGYDIDLISKISSKVNIPLIASGGVGNLDHLVDGIKLGNASAVLAASIFHYGKYSIQEAKEYLRIPLEFKMLNKLEKLIKLARDRKSYPVEGSYTNKLLNDKVLNKAKVSNSRVNKAVENSNKVHEAADVFYHLLMYLEANDIKVEDVMQELEKKMSDDIIILLQKFFVERYLVTKFMRMILFYHSMI